MLQLLLHFPRLGGVVFLVFVNRVNRFSARHDRQMQDPYDFFIAFRGLFHDIWIDQPYRNCGVAGIVFARIELTVKLCVEFFAERSFRAESIRSALVFDR